ncbi:histidinol phosphate aminotransferase [Ruegeria sp. ANG-S4]|uniref:peptidoglycan-binding domain-containing protein n=1 Tax=Ruegeria sp. ANG-S4 TaxID=1577904 RepID=UPI000580AF80|nr:peptidoglycan-binding protein [Ruegeria sp. ANG-S4]KIC45906.1 histidinol phosphate aminotransferase [Ruegeria sp. ANG-S4]
MALKLSAPVGDKKRITKADPKKNEKFKPVQNKPADVELVQLMLVANGFRVDVNGKCDTVLIKNIREFQKKKLGFKKPDGIVDPDAKTWKAGLPKLSAMISANAKLELYEVFEGGKKKLVSKKDYEAGLNALKREVLSKAVKMHSEAECWVDICNGFEKTRQAQDGLVNALVEFSVSVVNSDTNPPWDDILKARSEASTLKALAGAASPDWRRVQKQDQKATKAYNKAVKSFKKFIEARIGTAGGIVTGLEVVRDTSFAAVETYMTARLVMTKGMSPAKAGMIAASSVEALKSGAGQFGEYVAGNKVTWDGAAKKVFIDSFIAGLAGAAGGKLGDKLSKGLASQLAKHVMPKLSGSISTKAGELFFKRFLGSDAGQAMVVSALKETIGLMKPLIEKGQPPKLKDVKDAVTKTLLAGIMTHASVKALDYFTKNLPGKGEAFLKTIMAPKIMESMRKELCVLYGAKTFDELAAKHAGAIYVRVATSVSEKSIEKAALIAVSASDGSQSAAQLQKLANDELRKDAELRKKIQDMIRSEFARVAKKLPAPAN